MRSAVLPMLLLAAARAACPGTIETSRPWLAENFRHAPAPPSAWPTPAEPAGAQLDDLREAALSVARQAVLAGNFHAANEALAIAAAVSRHGHRVARDDRRFRPQPRRHPPVLDRYP